MVGNAWQVRVAQVGQQDGFQAELAGIFIAGKEVFLDRHIHAQIFIHGAVNRSHAPLSKDFDYSITFVEECSSFKSRSHDRLIIYQRYRFPYHTVRKP